MILLPFGKSHLPLLQKQLLLEARYPEVKLNNYAFHNNGDVTFTNVIQTAGDLMNAIFFKWCSLC